MKYLLASALVLLSTLFFSVDTYAEEIATPSKNSEDAKLLAEISNCKKQLKEHPDDRALNRQLALLLSQSKEGFAEAKAIFEKIAEDHEDSDSLMDLAGCFIKSDFEECYRLCVKAERLNNGKNYTLAMEKLGQGASRYAKGDLKPAVDLYRSSLEALTKHDVFLVPKLDLSGLGGAYYRLGDYANSLKAYEDLYRLDRDVYGAEDIECGWALLQNVYALNKAGQHELAQKYMDRAVYIFRKNNAERLIEEYKQDHGQKLEPEIAARVNASVFGVKNGIVPPDPISAETSPFTPKVELSADGFRSPWKRQFKQVEAPGWVWVDPTVPVKAVLICVHGLGLHHRAYDSFARRIAPEGIMTVAFDVRGFGTYTEANGMEKLSMKDCVDDLKNVTGLLRHDYPNLPLFILGESMGGGLALRVVAEAPDLVDGLICSVPAGSRYKALATAIKVGAGFLTDKSKPMPVGLSVVNQATSNEELRRAWINDPFSRLSITPAELIDFQLFMDQNVNFARQIAKKPVILFQGHDDKLVKESGTLDLFQALATPQKSLVLIGNTEHLIFEAGQFKDEITLGVIGWMIAHSPHCTGSLNKTASASLSNPANAPNSSAEAAFNNSASAASGSTKETVSAP